MEETTIWRENVLGRGGRAYKEWYDVDLAHDMRQGLSRTRVGFRRISGHRLRSSGRWLARAQDERIVGGPDGGALLDGAEVCGACEEMYAHFWEAE